MVATVISSGAGWAYWLVAAQRWSTSAVGLSLSLIAALSIIGLIAGQPLTTSMLVRLPQVSQQWPVLRSILAITTAGGLALGCVALVVLPSSMESAMTPTLRGLFLVSAGVTPIAIVLDGAMLVIRRSGLIVVRTLVHSLGKLALLVAFSLAAWSVGGPVAVLASWTVAQLIASCIVLLKWHRAAGEAVRVEPAGETSTVLRKGLVAQIAGTLAGSLPPQILPIVVVASLGTTQAAWFSITWLVGGLCFMISPAVSQTLLAEGGRRDRDLSQLVKAAAGFSLALLTVPVMVYLLAGRTILDLFGTDYGAAGGGLLIALAISSIPDLVTNLAVAVYRIRERLVIAALINCTIAVVAVWGSVIAVNHGSLAGVGWAWCAGRSSGVVLVGVVLAVEWFTAKGKAK